MTGATPGDACALCWRQYEGSPVPAWAEAAVRSGGALAHSGSRMVAMLPPGNCPGGARGGAQRAVGEWAACELAAGGGSGGVLAWYLVGRGANQSGGLCGVWAPPAHCHLEQELPQLCRRPPGHACWREVWTRQDIHLGATPDCAIFRRNQPSNDQFSSGVADGRAHCRTATRLWFPVKVYNWRASCG